MTDPLAPLLDRLHGEGRLRVWSLVITVFGDSVQHRGGGITTTRLGRLLGRLGVERGALRTALSRLARDGWVEGARHGRSATYRLTDTGRARFIPATSRIYAAPRAVPVRDWELRLGGPPAGPGSQALALGGFTLVPAAEGEATAPEGAEFVLRGRLAHLTDAMRAQLLDPEHAAALEALMADIDGLADAGPLEPLEAAAARTLLVHRWRRLVLRHPEAPAELLPPPLTGRDPRRAMQARYWALCPAAEAWLGSAAEDMAPMPGADTAFAQRFGGPVKA